MEIGWYKSISARSKSRFSHLQILASGLSRHIIIWPDAAGEHSRCVWAYVEASLRCLIIQCLCSSALCMSQTGQRNITCWLFPYPFHPIPYKSQTRALIYVLMTTVVSFFLITLLICFYWQGHWAALRSVYIWWKKAEVSKNRIKGINRHNKTQQCRIHTTVQNKQLYREHCKTDSDKAELTDEKCAYADQLGPMFGTVKTHII